MTRPYVGNNNTRFVQAEAVLLLVSHNEDQQVRTLWPGPKNKVSSDGEDVGEALRVRCMI
jgi:hypothetical protein